MGWTVHVKSQNDPGTHLLGILFPLPGKHVVKCSISASWVTGFLAEFIAEMAKQRISPSGINWDWLMGDILIGETSPAERQFSSKRFMKRAAFCHMHTFTHACPSQDSRLPPAWWTQSALNTDTAYSRSQFHTGRGMPQNRGSAWCLDKHNWALKPEMSFKWMEYWKACNPETLRNDLCCY